MRRVLLVLNTGSSSIKFALHDADSHAQFAKGTIEAIGRAACLTFSHAGETQTLHPDQSTHADTGALLDWLLHVLASQFGPLDMVAAGHRVVHGGQQFSGPAVVSQSVMDDLEALVPLAPGHQPHNLAGIRAVAALWPAAVQMVCFDTDFHQSRPRVAQLYAIPRALTDEGILRFGFHGLSYEHIAGRLPDVLGERVARGKVIVAHLGSGASLCAMQNGQSVDTTMGLTAMDGLMMGTRCGQIDPGVLLLLMRAKGLDAEALERLLSHESGLLGVSGISPDMRDLLANPAPEAAEAVSLFVHMILRQIGGLTATLGGLDALVFTAGIGERSPVIRSCVMAGLDWLGLVPDDAANLQNQSLLSAQHSKVVAAMIRTNEEAVILRAIIDHLR